MTEKGWSDELSALLSPPVGGPPPAELWIPEPTTISQIVVGRRKDPFPQLHIFYGGSQTFPSFSLEPCRIRFLLLHLGIWKVRDVIDTKLHFKLSFPKKNVLQQLP